MKCVIVVRIAALLMGSVCVAGCSFFTQMAARRVANAQIAHFQISVNKVEPFLSCVEAPTGTCPVADVADAARSFFPATSSGRAQEVLSTRSERPSPALDVSGAERAKTDAIIVSADVARAVLNHPVQAQLNNVFSFSRGAAPPELLDSNGSVLFATTAKTDGSVARVDISIADFDDYMRQVEAATLLDGWDALADEVELYDRADPADARRRAYIKHYFNAYFRGGKFFKATISGSDLLKKVTDELRAKVPGLEDDQYDSMARKLFPQYNFNPDSNEYVFGRIEDAGFVTRGGQKISFPAIEVSATLGDSSVSTPEIDYVAVGSDLVRVLLHAIFDAQMRVPAVSTASGITVPIDPLMVNKDRNVDEEEFERIETRATQVESAVASGVGRLVRGVSVFSLNNESLAKVIEASVGIAVRKPVEKILWCWYECKYNELGDTADYAATSVGNSRTIEVTVSGFPN